MPYEATLSLSAPSGPHHCNTAPLSPGRSYPAAQIMQQQQQRQHNNSTVECILFVGWFFGTNLLVINGWSTDSWHCLTLGKSSNRTLHPPPQAFEVLETSFFKCKEQSFTHRPFQHLTVQAGDKTRLVWAKQKWWILFWMDGFSRDPLKPSYINVVIPSNGDTCDLPNMKYQLFIDHLERPRNLPAWLQTTTRVSIRDEFRVRLWNVFPRKWWCIYSLSIYNNSILM